MLLVLSREWEFRPPNLQPSSVTLSGKSRVEFYAVVYNLYASVELQSAPCASKRFGAIPLGHFPANALPLEYPAHGSVPVRSPQACSACSKHKRCPFCLNLMPAEQVSKGKKYSTVILRASTRLGLTVNTGSASKRLYGTPIIPGTSNFVEADSASS